MALHISIKIMRKNHIVRIGTKSIFAKVPLLKKSNHQINSQIPIASLGICLLIAMEKKLKKHIFFT